MDQKLTGYTTNFKPLVKRLLISFLKKRGRYDEFVSNIGSGLEYICTPINPSLAVSYAFRWSATPQGYDYWHELSTEWSRLISQLENKLFC